MVNKFAGAPQQNEAAFGKVKSSNVHKPRGFAMPVFVELTLSVGPKVLLNIDHIVAIEPNSRDARQAVVRLSVGQSFRSTDIGVMELIPQSYSVIGTPSEILAAIQSAGDAKPQFPA